MLMECSQIEHSKVDIWWLPEINHHIAVVYVNIFGGSFFDNTDELLTSDFTSIQTRACRVMHISPTRITRFALFVNGQCI